jgi:hypothetical protein
MEGSLGGKRAADVAGDASRAPELHAGDRPTITPDIISVSQYGQLMLRLCRWSTAAYGTCPLQNEWRRPADRSSGTEQEPSRNRTYRAFRTPLPGRT